jgi:UDP-N-acetylglucosamine--N-acetylmuramyl-(pentapeptide) pyrophosphoryl-undecaprenol N-acetylglucosamine transferase
MEAPTILVAAGHGGHIAAAVAVADAVRARGGCPVLVVEAGPRGAAAATRMAPWCRQVVVADAGFPRSGGPGLWRQRLGVPVRLARTTSAVVALLTAVKPTAAIVLGGAVCGPLALLARARGVRVIVHEQNAVMGVANRGASGVADVVVGAFRGVGDQRIPVPVRGAFLATTPSPVSTGRSLLVVGGSSGSAALDDALADGVGRLVEAGFSGVHVTAGPRPVMAPGWRTTPFIDDMAAALAAADLVVTAAGAVSLAEAGAVRRPCLVLPRHDVAADHQRANTRAWQGIGAVLPTTASTLVDDVLALAGDVPQQQALGAALSTWVRAPIDGATWLAAQALP